MAGNWRQGPQCMGSEFSSGKAKAPGEPHCGLRRAAPGCNGLGAGGEVLGGPRSTPSLLNSFPAQEIVRWETHWSGFIIYASSFGNRLLPLFCMGLCSDENGKHRERARAWADSTDLHQEPEEMENQRRYLLHRCCFQPCPGVKVPFRETSSCSIWCSLQLFFFYRGHRNKQRKVTRERDSHTGASSTEPAWWLWLQ